VRRNYRSFLQGLIILPALVCFPMLSAATDGTEAKNNGVEKLPLYEYGVVGLVSRLPQYRGSGEYSNYYFPVPYFVYRGETLKADEEGMRTIFWHTEHWQTDISFSGNPPVSNDNKAREGMPELNAIGECGPAIRYYFYDRGEWDVFYLQASVRAAFAIGFEDGGQFAYAGYTGEFAVAYLNSKLLEEQKIRLALGSGLLYGDEEFHDYFYEVSAPYATETRAEYDAEPGYGGLWASVSATREVTPSFWISLYGRWLNSSGATFADSPLVETENNYIAGLLLIYKIGESEARQK